MPILTDSQIKALKFHLRGEKIDLPRSTKYDAYKRAQKNIDELINQVVYLINEGLLKEKHVRSLKKALKAK
jgi:hypothetical protein